MFVRTMTLTVVVGCLLGLPDAGAQTRRITLANAVRAALAGHGSIEIANLQRRAALARATSARGAFAPRPFVESSYGSSTVVTESSFIDSNLRYSENELRFGIGVVGKLPTGASYALRLSTSRFDTDASSAALTPSYLTSAELTVAQPLLRGAFGASTEAVDVAEREGEAARANIEATASDLALAVVVAYWQLATAQNAETVAQQSVELSRAQLEATRLRIRGGRLSPLDETSAEAAVAVQEDARVAAQQERSARAMALLSLLTPRPGQRVGGDPELLEAEDAPRAAQGGRADSLATAVRAASRRRPELRALRALVEAARRHADALERDALPDLSLTGTVGAHGIAGDRVPICEGVPEPCEPLPDFLQGGLGQSVSNAPDSPYYSIGARLELPLPNGEAGGRADAAEMDARARAAQLRQAEWQIQVEVGAAVRALAEALERLQTAEAAQTLAEQSLQGEQRKFEAGVSTTFEVLRVQQSLTLAKNARFATRAAVEIARARLAHETGTLLSELGVRDALR